MRAFITGLLAAGLLGGTAEAQSYERDEGPVSFTCAKLSLLS